MRVIDIQSISEGEALSFIFEYVRSLDVRSSGTNHSLTIFPDGSGSIDRLSAKESRIMSWHKIADAAQFIKGMQNYDESPQTRCVCCVKCGVTCMTHS